MHSITLLSSIIDTNYFLFVEICSFSFLSSSFFYRRQTSNSLKYMTWPAPDRIIRELMAIEGKEGKWRGIQHEWKKKLRCEEMESWEEMGKEMWKLKADSMIDVLELLNLAPRWMSTPGENLHRHFGHLQLSNYVHNQYEPMPEKGPPKTRQDLISESSSHVKKFMSSRIAREAYKGIPIVDCQSHWWCMQ